MDGSYVVQAVVGQRVVQQQMDLTFVARVRRQVLVHGRIVRNAHPGSV